MVVALLQQLLPQGIIWQPSFEKMPTTTHISCTLYFWCMQTGEWVEKLFHEYLADFRDPTMYWMLWALFWICQNACSFKAAQFSSMGKEYVRADVTAHGACVCDLQCGCLNACSKKTKLLHPILANSVTKHVAQWRDAELPAEFKDISRRWNKCMCNYLDG